MIELCTKCGRERPDYFADPSCSEGGYCEWVEQNKVQNMLARALQLVGGVVELMEKRPYNHYYRTQPLLMLRDARRSLEQVQESERERITKGVPP